MEAVKKVIVAKTGPIYSKYFSDHTGNKIYFKPEYAITGAYKLERRLLHNRYAYRVKRDREV